MIDGDRMRKDWNERATINTMEAVVNNRDDWSEEDFLETGRSTVMKYAEPLFVPGYQDHTVLEIGCGAGRLTVSLSELFKRVIALDVSTVMLNAARKMIKKWAEKTADVSFIAGDGTTFQPVGDESVDAVFSVIVFQHIPVQELQYGYMREIARVLKRGGRFSITLYGDMGEYENLKKQWEFRRQSGQLFGWSEKAKVELDRYETGMCNAVPYDETHKVLAEAGLKVLKEEGARTGVWWIAGEKE